jgi:hypothetical protein
MEAEHVCKEEVSETSSSEAFLDDGDKVGHLGELVHEDPNGIVSIGSRET